jgi:hypothetical protein
MLYHVLENSKQCRDCARVDMIWFSFGILSDGNGQMLGVDLSLWQGVAEVQQKVNEVHEENKPFASPCKILVTNSSDSRRPLADAWQHKLPGPQRWHKMMAQRQGHFSNCIKLGW